LIQESLWPQFKSLPVLPDGIPSLSIEQQAELKLPFTLGELPEVVESDASFKTPGLNSLSNELYKATFGQVDPSWWP
jgi:hypothetical protein